MAILSQVGTMQKNKAIKTNKIQNKNQQHILHLAFNMSLGSITHPFCIKKKVYKIQVFL